MLLLFPRDDARWVFNDFPFVICEQAGMNDAATCYTRDEFGVISRKVARTGTFVAIPYCVVQ